MDKGIVSMFKLANPLHETGDGIKTLALLSYVYLIIDGIIEILSSLISDLSPDETTSGLNGFDYLMIALAICIGSLVYFRSNYQGDELVQKHIMNSWRVFRAYFTYYICFIFLVFALVFVPSNGLANALYSILQLAAYSIPLLFLILGVGGLNSMKNSKFPDDRILNAIEFIR